MLCWTQCTRLWLVLRCSRKPTVCWKMRMPGWWWWNPSGGGGDVIRTSQFGHFRVNTFVKLTGPVRALFHPTRLEYPKWCMLAGQWRTGESATECTWEVGLHFDPPPLDLIATRCHTRAGFHILLEESENYRLPESANETKAATKGLFQFLLASPVPESGTWVVERWRGKGQSSWSAFESKISSGGISVTWSQQKHLHLIILKWPKLQSYRAVCSSRLVWWKFRNLMGRRVQWRFLSSDGLVTSLVGQVSNWWSEVGTWRWSTTQWFNMVTRRAPKECNDLTQEDLHESLFYVCC